MRAHTGRMHRGSQWSIEKRSILTVVKWVTWESDNINPAVDTSQLSHSSCPPTGGVRHTNCVYLFAYGCRRFWWDGEKVKGYVFAIKYADSLWVTEPQHYYNFFFCWIFLFSVKNSRIISFFCSFSLKSSPPQTSGTALGICLHSLIASEHKTSGVYQSVSLCASGCLTKKKKKKEKEKKVILHLCVSSSSVKPVYVGDLEFKPLRYIMF